ncbi:hypothetical protein [Embleya sp. NPDC001921]
MAHDARPPGDGDHVEYTLDAQGRSPGIVQGRPQRGRVWVKPNNGDAKWSAPIKDVRVIRRYQATRPTW